jgi:hypothetical protein
MNVDKTFYSQQFFMKIELATKITSDLVKISGDFDETLRLIETNCNQDEFRSYRKAFGNLMGTMYLDILEPLFKEHPSLIPPNWSWLNKKKKSSTRRAASN